MAARNYNFSDNEFRATLQKVWGYPDFRPAQLDIIRSVTTGNDTIGLLPTGGGKSITFQVPALMIDGLTLVVTPLISLMKDQVDNLRQQGVRAVYLHSGLTRRERDLAMDRCRLGKAKMMYVSPEKLQSERFLDQIRFLNVGMIVVDEAHCISQWGYDFRPTYLKINALRKMFPDAPVLALTASATPAVLADIADKLAMRTPNIYRLSFTRDNISFVVRYTDSKEAKMVEILKKMPGTAIVYVRSRVRTKQLAEVLARAGISAEFYHAGLSPQDKDERQNRWKEGTTRVIVATTAFGMGIDKADVRIVIHHDLPSSLEEYYQEAGRAGRDGKPAVAVLLVNNTDKGLLSRRLNDAFPSKETIMRIYELMGNFLEVGVGEGYGRMFDFNMNLFCTRFKYMPNVVHNSLQILDRAGYITYNEELSTRSRLMMIMERRELYEVSTDPTAERILQYILRNYTGIFADYEHINESAIAYSLGITEEAVYQGLLLLTRIHVLHYIPKKTSTYVIYSTSREEPRYMSLPKAVYEDRRKRMEERVEAMKNFAFGNDGCRVNRMLRYFGESPENPCGKCDVCRDSKPKNVDTKQIGDVIMAMVAASGSLHIDAIVDALHVKADIVIAEARRLVAKGRLTLDGMTLSVPDSKA